MPEPSTTQADARGMRIGIGLFAAGALLVAVGLLLWGRASDQQEEDRIAAGFERAILLDRGKPELAATVDVDPSADRTVPIVVLTAGGAAVVAGVVVRTRD